MNDNLAGKHTRLARMPALADPRVSDRKRRLFAVACLERVAHRLVDPRSLHALEVARQLADGRAEEAERQEAEDLAFEAYLEMCEGRRNGSPTLVPWSWQQEQLTRAAALVVAQGFYYAEDVADYVQGALGDSPSGGWLFELQEERRQLHWLTDILGPFPEEQVKVDPLWLAANDGAVIQLARSIDAQGDFDALPILADALEEAGCADSRLLDHCRQPGEHIRGCWVIDLLLDAI